MDASALDRIAREHGDALSRVAWGYVSSAADHDDLLQDILIAIWRALPRFRGDASERTFVFRIAHNRGCTFAASHREHETLNAESTIADPRPSPHDAAEQAQDRARLVAAVRTLPAAQRQAVLLRLEGFGIAEIAALQGTSENNVSVRLTRARELLRQQLGGDR
ncbi:MAG TPA: sigma-70 family RNA polymerase sigma factor [Gemmatimonadaceae bacterium]